MRRLLILLLASTLLTGCASSVLKTNGSTEVKFIEIRPMTQHGFGYSNLIGVSLFGILGANLDNKAVRESPESINSLLTGALSQETLLRRFESSAKPVLSNLFPNANITLNMGSTGDQFKNIGEWFSKDTGVKISSGVSNFLVIEVGYNFEAVRKLQGLDADGWLGIRIVDASAGQVVGKALENSLATMSGVRILKPGSEVDREEFVKESSRAFQELVETLTKRAMTRVSQ